MNWKSATLLKSIDDLIWHTPVDSRTNVRARAARPVRTLVVLVRDLRYGRLTLHAMGLVYTTLLSLVPLLAISFSVLKAFGVTNQVRPMLLRFLAPLGEQNVEVTSRITGFIDNIHGGVLGSVGLALLLYTSVSLVQKIEEAFNYIWHVSRSRSFGERFTRYVSALLVGPLLVFSAIGLTAAATNSSWVRDAMQIEAIGWLASHAALLVPFVLVICAFAFFYIFIPNTKVRIGPALVGAFVGGAAWQTAGWGFAQFAANSTNYSAIYSGFAILILFMLWLYLSWLILLFGSDVAFYVQHPEYLVKKRGEPRLSNRLRERLALVIMSMIARHHLEGGLPWSADALAQSLRMPLAAIDMVLTALQSRGMLTPTGDSPPRWLPTRALEAMSVQELLDAVRTAGEDGYLGSDALPGSAAVEQLLQRYEEATESALRGISLRELAGTAPQPVEASTKTASAI